MLVIANGTFKSGSTWQRDIIKGIIKFDDLPQKYRNKKIKTFIKNDCIEEFISSNLIRENNYIAKAHLFQNEYIDLLKNKPNVFVFMIERDIKDTIVSHYHHFKIQRNRKISFKMYYWLVGRFKAMQIIKYNNNWNIEANNVLHSTFEALKGDFNSEVKKFAYFLGVTISEDDVERIKEETNINKVKENSDRKWFFRKGETGDYLNYFNKSMINDLAKVSKSSSLIDEVIYFLLFEIRLYFKHVFMN